MANLQTSDNNSLRASASLAANTTDNKTLNMEGPGGPLQATINIDCTPGGTVAAGAQLTVNVLVSTDGGSTFATVPLFSVAIPSVISTRACATIVLEGGKYYRIAFVNTDASNAITTLVSTYSLVTSIS